MVEAQPTFLIGQHLDFHLGSAEMRTNDVYESPFIRWLFRQLQASGRLLRWDALTLTRLWLADDLPRNSEPRVIGQLLKALRRHTPVKFLVSHADPSHGHVGTVYQASNWLYTGESQPTPLHDPGAGVGRHSRTVSTALGSRDRRFLRKHGVPVTLVPQSRKHRYVFFLDRRWRGRLLVPELPHPRKKGPHGDS